MTNNMPSGTKKFHKSIEPECHQTAKRFLLRRTLALLAMPFSKLDEMHTNHLVVKQLSFMIVELEIWLCASTQGDLEFWHPFLTQYFKRAWSKILQSILHTSAEEAYEDRHAAL